MHQSFRFDVSQAGMCCLADQVMQFRIRAHLGTTPRHCPCLGRSDQCLANPLLANIGVNIPTLDIANVAGCAAFRIGSDPNFHKGIVTVTSGLCVCLGK